MPIIDSLLNFNFFSLERCRRTSLFLFSSSSAHGKGIRNQFHQTQLGSIIRVIRAEHGEKGMQQFSHDSDYRLQRGFPASHEALRTSCSSRRADGGSSGKSKSPDSNTELKQSEKSSGFRQHFAFMSTPIRHLEKRKRTLNYTSGEKRLHARFLPFQCRFSKSVLKQGIVKSGQFRMISGRYSRIFSAV
jgi:hypothetical protein